MPAMVDFGAQSPRLQTYCDALIEIDGQPALLLRPIATAALARGSARIFLEDPVAPMVLRAETVVRYGDEGAAILLDSTRASTLARRGRPRTCAAPLAALIPAVSDDLGIHAFPVSNVSAEWCAIDTPFGLAPGTELDHVEIVSGQRTLRRSGGVVAESIPFRMPTGEAVYRVRLALRTERTRAKRHDVIAIPEKLRAALRNAAALKVAVAVSVPGREQLEAEVVAVDAAEMRLTLRALPAAMPEVGQLLSMGFELFTDQFETEVRVLSRSGASATVTLPLVLRRRHRRQEQRTPVPMRGQLRIRFDNPATGETLTRHVLDVSFGGLCLAPEPTDVLWRDLPLTNAVLLWNGPDIRLDEARVRACEGGTAHLEVARHDTSGDVHMIDLVASIRHPALQRDDGSRFALLRDLHRAVGAFSPRMERNIAVPEASETWLKMHRDASDVCRTLACWEDGRPVATVSAVRAFEHAWMPGQMAALPNRRWRAPAGLDLAYTDNIVMRPDAHHTVMFVKVGNRRQTDFIGGFLANTGTPEVGRRSTVDQWCIADDEARARAPFVVRGITVTPMRRRQETLVARAAARVLGRIPAAALSLVPGELRLPDTTRRYRRAGLARWRECFIVARDGVPVLATIHEHAPAAMNFASLLSSTWLIPIHPELDRDGEATRVAIDHATRRRAPTAAGDHFFLAPEPYEKDVLVAAGLALELPFHMYAYNRAGTQRWYDYVHALRGGWMVSQAETADAAHGLRRRRVS